MTTNRIRSIELNACALFALLLVLYFLTFNGQFGSIDELNLYAMTESLVQNGTIEVPQVNFAAYHNPVGKHEIGFPLAAMPLYWLSRNSQAVNNIYIVMLLNPLLVSASAVFIYLSAKRLGQSSTASLVAAFAYGLGSLGWPYALTFYREPLVGFLWILGIYGLISWRMTENKWWGGLGAIAILLSPLVKVNVSFSIPFLFLVTQKNLLAQKKHTYVIWGIALAGMFVVFQGLYYLRTGYWWNFSQSLTTISLIQVFLRLHGQLLSPIKGLVFYMPVIILAGPGLYQLWRRHRSVAAGIILASLSLLGATSFYGMWYGGQSWGPRLLVPVLPIVLIAIAPLWDRFQRPVARALMLSLLAISTIVQTAVATNPWWKGYAPFHKLALTPENNVGLSLRHVALSPPWVLLRNWQSKDLNLLWLHVDKFGEWRTHIVIGVVLALCFLGIIAIWRLRIAQKAGFLALLPLIPAIAVLQIAGGNIIVGYPGLSKETAQNLAAWVRFNNRDPYTLVTLSNEFHIFFYTGLLKGDFIHHWYSPNQTDQFENILENTKGQWLFLVEDHVHVEPAYSGRDMEWWLNNQLYRFDSQWLDGYELIRYGILPSDGWDSIPIQNEFGPFHIKEVAVNTTALHANNVLGIQLHICKSAEISDNHRIFLHLLADGEIIKGLDGPVHYGAPDTNQWEIGECLIEKRGIYIPPEANAGTYDLIAGVYSLGDEGPNPYETLMQITVLASGIDNSQR